MMNTVTCMLLTCFLIITGGCKPGNREHPEINSYKNEYKPELIRSEKVLYHLEDSASAHTRIRQWLKDNHAFYRTFFVKFLGNTLQISDTTPVDTVIGKFISYFALDPHMQELKDSVIARFKDNLLQRFIKNFSSSAGKIPAIKPSYDLPQKIYTAVAPFAGKCILDSGLLIIFLDMYLGPDFKYYASTPYPNYMIRTFQPAYMERDALLLLLEDAFPQPAELPHLLAHMIYRGKILYAASILAPHIHDTTWLGWTSQQLAWAEKYEAEIWQYFLKRDWLFESDYIRYRKFISPGPTTPGLSPKSPGNLGSWIGWQIVKAFMKNHPEWTLQQLLEHPDSTGVFILNNSGYNPQPSWLKRTWERIFKWGE